MRPLLSQCRHLWIAMGLRGRLVAGYTALFAVLLLVIALGETTVVRQVLIDGRRAALPVAMNDLSSFLGKSPGPGNQSLVVRSLDGSVLALQTSFPSVAGDSDMVLALLGTDGSVLSQVAGANVRDVDPRQLLDASYLGAAQEAPVSYERTAGGTAYLVELRTVGVTVQARVGQGPSTSPPPLQGAQGTVEGASTAGSVSTTNVTALVAQSLRSVDDTVHTLLFVTLAASALGLVLAGAAGMYVAGRALRPLQRMTVTAQSISDGGDGALDQRLRLPVNRDEVGRLANTFDRMLDRIQETIAERVRSETQLRHFAADASHELRTPLAAVSGYAEVLLLGGKDDPETTEYALRQMSGELDRMNRLVADLLTLARLEAGIPMHIDALPVVPVLDALVEETRLLAAGSGRDLKVVHTQTEEAYGLTVLADHDRLRQILLNLLHNAVKFTPDGGSITVRGARRDGKIILSVADTGAGIPSAELPHLFERFYRGDKARTREDSEGGGAGLGLAIAQGLAHAQGGHIEATSRSGAGSTFTVTLPAAPDAGGEGGARH